GGRLGQLARKQVVTQVARGHIDDGALLTEGVHVLEQNRLGHVASFGLAVAVPVPVPVAVSAPAYATTSGFGHVRQQGELTRALDRAGDLALVAPARSGDPARADLAALRDEPAQHRDVLVVDLVD